MISILARGPAFGAAYNVKKALSVMDATVLICAGADKWRSWPKGTIDAIVTTENAERCAQVVRASRFVFLVGGSAVVVLGMLPGYEKWAPELNLAAWFTDTFYRRSYATTNALLHKLGCKKYFLLPDDVQYILSGIVPLYHPTSLAYPGNQSGTLTIMHSPGLRSKRRQKGSDAIEQVIRELRAKYKFNYQCLMGLQHEECLQQKRAAHIFIHALPTGHTKGLAKSGLEAMASGAVTLSVLSRFNTKAYFDPPPIFEVSGVQDLEKALTYLLDCGKEELQSLGSASRAWIEKYWGVENGAWLRYLRRYIDL